MNCRKCGGQISAGESFCPRCGTKVQNTQMNTETICPVCETLNLPDATHCAICGEELPKITSNNTQNNGQHSQGAEQIFCMHCGTPNPASNCFCLNCGKNLKEKPAIESTPYKTPEKRPEKSYMPIIIGLIIVAIVSVVVAIFVVFSDYWFVLHNDSPEPTETISVAQTQIPTVEPTEEPTEKPTPTPSMRPTPIPTQTNDYSYSVYNDYDFAFSCPYPSDSYRIDHSVSKFHKYCINTYDGSTIHICGTNSNGRTAAKIADGFKKEYYHTNVITNTIGSNFCSILITDGYTYHYCYYSLTENMVRGFEMSFDVDYYDTYMDHADYMRANLSL